MSASPATSARDHFCFRNGWIIRYRAIAALRAASIFRSALACKNPTTNNSESDRADFSAAGEGSDPFALTDAQIRLRPVAVPVWIKKGMEEWKLAAGINEGPLLRKVNKADKIHGEALTGWGVWSIVEQSAKEISIEHFGAHDLRRTCAKLCRKAGGYLVQINFLLGHSSIQTTERYLGLEQEIKVAVNDNLGL